MTDTVRVTLATSEDGEPLRAQARFKEGTLLPGEELTVNRPQGELMAARGEVRILREGETAVPRPKAKPKRRPKPPQDPAPVPSETDPEFLS